MLDISKMKHIGLFAGGVLFGTAGVKVLASKDAQKLYINCLADGLRAKEINRVRAEEAAKAAAKEVEETVEEQVEE